jgi:hypothetical protein
MKFMAMLLALSSLSSFAATVHSAKLDAAKKNILVDVSYGGGCKKHTFTLKVGGCMETYPVRCSADLVEKTVGGFDACEAIISETVKINLAKYRLDEAYYANGSLTIMGDVDMSGKRSSATVVLP